MVVSKENLHQISNLRTALERLPARWDDSMGAVSIIGTGITASNQRVIEGSLLLRELDAHSYGVATSSFRITWLVEREKVDKIVQSFHRIFIENANPTVP